MKIKYISDIHNDYNRENHLLKYTGDADTVLVVAGDINSKGRSVSDLEAVADRWKAIVAVAGNHDWWGLSLDEKHKFDTDVDNLHILLNNYVKIDNVIFCGTTLWHEVGADEYWWKQTMVDAKKIRGPNYSRLHGADIDIEHMNAVEFIKDCQSVFAGKKKVLVTHHALTGESVSERYRGSSSNKYYYTHHPELLEGFDYHIHGHMHSPSDYEVFGCNVLCNPLGHAGENKSFNGLKEIEL